MPLGAPGHVPCANNNIMEVPPGSPAYKYSLLAFYTDLSHHIVLLLIYNSLFRSFSASISRRLLAVTGTRLSMDDFERADIERV